MPKPTSYLSDWTVSTSNIQWNLPNIATLCPLRKPEVSEYTSRNTVENAFCPFFYVFIFIMGKKEKVCVVIM